MREWDVYDFRMRNLIPMILSGLLLTVAAMASQPSASETTQLAIVQDRQIDESSGLAASYVHPGHLWVHNDSGDKPRLFLIDLKGQTRAIVKIGNADAVDWEDMCTFQAMGQSWLLIGDVGDNNRERTLSRQPACLYLLKEPSIRLGTTIVNTSRDAEAIITFDYQGGPWNCEGVAVDTERQEILLLTKSLPQHSGLYRLPLDLQTEQQQLTARRIASPFIPFATALDISPDNRTMVVATMLNGLVIRRSAAQSWSEAFTTPGSPFSLPPRQQGETICFDITSRWLFLNSEKPRQPLWHMPVPTP